MKLKLGMIALSLLTLLFVACSNDDNDGPNNQLPKTEAELKQAIQKEWIVAGSSDYSSFEFKADGSYHVVKKDGSILIGDYTIGSDLKTITMDGLGSIVLENLSNDKLDFKLKPEESTTEQNVSCTPFTGTYEMKLLYHISHDGSTGLYICNMDGSNEKMVYLKENDTYKLDYYGWYPENGKIIFGYDIWDGNSYSTEIYTINIDGSGKQKMQQDKGIAVSPDCKKIAYSDRSSYNIYVCNIDGSNAKKLTSYTDDTFADTELCWTPNGKSIVYVAINDDPKLATGSWLCSINADGSNQKTLASSDEGIIFAPRVSPNGKQICYELNGNIMACDINGQNNKVLLKASTISYDFLDEPYWTTDGKSIVFTASIGKSENYGYIMNADGSNPKKLNIASTSGHASGFSVGSIKLYSL